MVTASELERLEGKVIEQIDYDPYSGTIGITVNGGSKQDGIKTLSILAPSGTMIVSVW